VIWDIFAVVQVKAMAVEKKEAFKVNLGGSSNGICIRTERGWWRRLPVLV
jgi:hypothetical protein